MENNTEITVLQEIKLVQLDEERDDEPIPPGVDVMDLTSDEMPSFTIDTCGSKSKLNNTLFETDVVGILEHERNTDEKEDVIEESSDAGQCFNCRGRHQLNQCSEPRNQLAINKNRLEFLANSIPKARYHGDEAQKFDHIKPGRISRRLRDALNLRSKDLPTFIYKMRVYGYPPGWLEEAKLEQSGIDIDDGDTNGTATISKGSTLPVQYDYSKIIEYPGFNTEARDYYDRATRERHIPPMQPCHMKEYMIDRLMQDAALQIETSRTRTREASYTKSEDIDPSSSDDVVYVETIQSSSLEELEHQKQLLLSQLEMVHDDSTADLTMEESSTASPVENVVDILSPSEVDTLSQDSNLPEALHERNPNKNVSRSDSVMSRSESSSSVVELGTSSEQNNAPVGDSETSVEQNDPSSNLLRTSMENKDDLVNVLGSSTKETVSSVSLTLLEEKDTHVSNSTCTVQNVQDSTSVQSDNIIATSHPVDKRTCSPNFCDSTPRLGLSKEVDHGTPISVRFSPYSRLPKFDNFASGVGELEMSPPVASTGTYNKVKSVLAERKKGLGLIFTSPRGK